MKRKNIIIICVIIFIVIVGFSLFWIQNNKEQQKTTESSEELMTSHIPDPTKDFSFIDNGNYIVTNTTNLGVGSRYAVTTQSRRKKGEAPPLTRKKGYENYWVVYDLDNNFNMVKYDIYDAVEKYDSSYAYYATGNFVIEVNESDYLLVSLVKLDSISGGNRETKVILMNLADGTFSELPSDLVEVYKAGSYSDEDFYGSYWDSVTRTMLYGDLDNQYGISFSYNYFGKTPTFESLSSQPDLNLFSEYPDLYDKIYKEDYQIFFRPDRVSPEKYFNDLLHWFAPSGTSSMTTYIEGLDGKATATSISSYADYQTWLANGAIR